MKRFDPLLTVTLTLVLLAPLSACGGGEDGDGDLDSYVGTGGGSDLLILNDGAGSFTDSEQPLGHGLNVGVALGDLDGS